MKFDRRLRFFTALFLILITLSAYAVGKSTQIINENTRGNVILKANWVKTTTDFDYTGSVQTFTAPADGVYRLEVWGGARRNIFNCYWWIWWIFCWKYHIKFQ